MTLKPKPNRRSDPCPISSDVVVHRFTVRRRYFDYGTSGKCSSITRTVSSSNISSNNSNVKVANVTLHDRQGELPALSEAARQCPTGGGSDPLISTTTYAIRCCCCCGGHLKAQSPPSSPFFISSCVRCAESWVVCFPTVQNPITTRYLAALRVACKFPIAVSACGELCVKAALKFVEVEEHHAVGECK